MRHRARATWAMLMPRAQTGISAQLLNEQLVAWGGGEGFIKKELEHCHYNLYLANIKHPEKLATSALCRTHRFKHRDTLAGRDNPTQQAVFRTAAYTACLCCPNPHLTF